MLFDGDGLAYSDLKGMDMAEYYECIAAKEMFVAFLKEKQTRSKGGVRMADERALSFGVQFGTNTAPIDELNEKQKKAQQEAEQTAEKLEQVGTSLTDIGSRATSAFNNVSGAGTKMGTSVRSAMLNSITAGDS
jgi:serine phosphatase RsbU (regulator of sigma subunit)